MERGVGEQSQPLPSPNHQEMNVWTKSTNHIKTVSFLRDCMQLSQISQKSLKRNGTNGTLRVGSVDKPGSMQSRKQRVAAGIGEKQKYKQKKEKKKKKKWLHTNHWLPIHLDQ